MILKLINFEITIGMDSKSSINSFNSKEKAELYNKTRKNTNNRYPQFNQSHFTAGDKNQFMNSLRYIPIMGQTTISLEDNKFSNMVISEKLNWDAYKSLTPDALSNTFDYLFNRYKKGIFVSIRNNKVVTFLPFSNAHYKNSWHPHAGFNISDVNKCLRTACKHESRKFNPNKVNRYIEQWYSNNCLVRYEFPISEGDAGVQQIADMLTCLCDARPVPDIDFFVNKRDFPIIKYTGQEAYEAIDTSYTPTLTPTDLAADGQPSVHQIEKKKYIPVLSMTTTNSHADITIPTWEDWTRVASTDEGKFFSKPTRDYNYKFNTSWETKKSCAVFRGSSTGKGIDINTNMRLKIAHLSHQLANPDILDAGITKWNMRPRLSTNQVTKKLSIQTIDIDSLGFSVVDPLSPEQQSNYQYIVNIDGHSSAYRLALELSMGSVVFRVGSEYNLWFTNYLKPWTHYIPIASDLSDLFEQIEWAKKNDSKCKKIASNALEFYNKYLCRDGIFDYLQCLLVDISNISGSPYITHKSNLTPLYGNPSPPTTLIGSACIHDSTPYQPSLLKNMHLPSELSYPVYESLNRIFKNHFTNLNSVDLGTGVSIPLADAITASFSNSVDIANTKNNIIRTHQINQHAGIILSKLLKSTEPDKISELIHSYNVGQIINRLITFSDNFAYTFILLSSQSSSQHALQPIPSYCILQQNIQGLSFLQWLESKDFNITEYYSIVLQIAFALNTAHRHCGFIHNDLYPWNIMLKKYQHNVLIGYRYCGKQFSFKTKLVPVIIDYGKANIIIDGYYNKPNECAVEIQDIITMLVTSANIILTKQHINHCNVDPFIRFMNFIAGGKYTNFTQFSSLRGIKNFTFAAKKYDEIINSDKGSLANKSFNCFINWMLINYYDDAYLTGKCPRSPTINLDDIIMVGTVGSVGSATTVLDNIAIRLNNFLEKTIEFTTQTNCLQFTKYYQNMYRSINYLKYLVGDVGVQLSKIPGKQEVPKSKYSEIDILINHCFEKLSNKWAGQLPNYSTIKKLQSVSVFIPIKPNINSNMELTNIDAAVSLLSEYDFSIYKKIHYNRLLMQTFEECQHFISTPAAGQTLSTTRFTMPHAIQRYYSKILTESESSPLLTAAPNHGKQEKSGLPIKPNEYNIMMQYIHIVQDKTILKQFIKQLDCYRTHLAIHQMKQPSLLKNIDFSYNEKLVEFGEMVSEILTKNNIL